MKHKEKIYALLEELIEGQKKTLMNCAQSMIPHLTYDDILQPNDYAELEVNPLFRYEEGVLSGMKTVQTALFALFQENPDIVD